MRVGLAFLALREDGHVLLRRRPEAGLLGGMLEVPSTEWAETLPPVAEALRGAPVRADWWALPGVVAHTFTHFRLETLVYRAIVPADASLTFWADPRSAANGSPAATSTAPPSLVSCARSSPTGCVNRRLGRASAMTQHKSRSPPVLGLRFA